MFWYRDDLGIDCMSAPRLRAPVTRVGTLTPSACGLDGEAPEVGSWAGAAP